MSRSSFPSVITPLTRAIGQLSDPVFRRVLWRSLIWSALGFLLLHLAAIWAMQRIVAQHGWLAWAAGLFGSIAASLLAFWLFLPVAAGIGTLYIDRIADAVEHRHYPTLPPARAASLLAQAWDGLAVALRVLVLNIVALALALLLPGPGSVFGWIVAGYAIGRGLFVATAMRRMPRYEAERLYRQNRLTILAQGTILAFSSYIPAMNLLIPLLGTAAMVHILDTALATNGNPGLQTFS